MKKILIAFLVCLISFSLCACGKVGADTPTDRMYTIQYTDGMGVHSIEVQCGELYSITSIPEKNGYEFIGLYDAEVGGTQYVNAGGSAVAAFTDSKNIVLYPQFKAKEYTLVLDYQGAAVTGSRSIKVAYDSEISELPLNLTLENKNFVGWFTEPNRKGNQIADQYGVLPENRKVTEKLFDLYDPDGNIKLYAGFKGEEFTVTFYFTESGAPEEVKVEYGTPISEVQLETRIDGKAVLVWSKKRNDTNKEYAFTGKVTSEMVLYAAEFAPVIDFDSNGGNSINSVIARAGDAINLPTPIREKYKFFGWQTVSGSTFSATTMPTSSIKLTAKWQAMIMFDTNGGTDVTDISEPHGTRITLPRTEKDGYIFAGWYDGSGNVYTTVEMPNESIQLCAKYYKTLLEKIVLIDDSTDFGNANYGSSGIPTKPTTNNWCLRLDVSKYFNSEYNIIKITASYKSSRNRTTTGNPNSSFMAWYSENTASDAYKVWAYEDKYTNGNKNVYERSVRQTEIRLTSQCLYICFYCGGGGYSAYYYWSDFYVEIEYPDMSTLY